MKLDAWLRQGHPLAERLRLVEHLAQALNAVHDRGEALAGLAPDRVEVDSDLQCDLSAARRGSPEPGYAAPERLEGGRPTTAADVYSAGALAWEALVGRPCGTRPVPLGEVAPGLPEELASAVMGCLERSPQWRPKDLTYLAQLAVAHQKPLRRGAEAPAPRAPARATPTPRTPPRRPSRSHLPLVLAALFLVAAAAGSYSWLQRSPAGRPGGGAAPADRPRASAQAPPPAEAPAPSPAATPSPAEAAALAPATQEGEPAAPPAPIEAPPADAPVEVPSPTVPPEPTPAPGQPPTPATTEAAPEPPPATETAPAPAVAAPREPVVLSALSPLSVRRPGKVLLDVRGIGLRPDLSARVLPLREAPRGIVVAGQKWVSPTLLTVLLELDATVAPGTYALTLEDAAGRQAKPLSFTVKR